MGEVITEKDKEYEAQERAAAPGDDQGLGGTGGVSTSSPQLP